MVTIFDLDHTLLKTNISFVFGQFLYRKGYVSLSTCLVLACAYFLHFIRLLSAHQIHAISFYFLFYKKDKKEVELLAEECVDEQLDRLIRPELKKIIQELSEKGEAIWIQSSSPEFLVAPIAKRLAVTKWLGTTYCLDASHKYSQLSQVVDGKAKCSTLFAIDASQVTVYSDSVEDLPLLQAVGFPVVVSERGWCGKKLKKIAKKNGWAIIEV
ncbi:MAG: hypothetical protein JWO53_458 [Chlamydiia bacterium]|nr:hypothetical protein [Chlamydiia bacterium]